MAGVITLRLSIAVIALIAGILILAFPKALRIFIGLYLLIIGIIGILDNIMA